MPENENIENKNEHEEDKETNWNKSIENFSNENLNWLTSANVETRMREYYQAAESEGFNASFYFADQVNQYINRKNITPDQINELKAKNTEYLDIRVLDISNVSHDRVENAQTYYTFWIDMKCFRQSKK